MIVENFDLNNGCKFVSFLNNYDFENNKDNHYVQLFVYHLWNCRKYNQNKLIIGLMAEDYAHLLVLLNGIDKNLMAEVEKKVDGNWNQVLKELGAIKQ